MWALPALRFITDRGIFMEFIDWLSVFAIIFALFSFFFSWKWASDSNRNLQEIRRVAEDIARDVEYRTREIERRVEERTKDIERMVDIKTTNIERILEDRLRELIDRAAPKTEQMIMNNVLEQIGPDLFRQAFENPEMFERLSQQVFNGGKGSRKGTIHK